MALGETPETTEVSSPLGEREEQSRGAISYIAVREVENSSSDTQNIAMTELKLIYSVYSVPVCSCLTQSHEGERVTRSNLYGTKK